MIANELERIRAGFQDQGAIQKISALIEELEMAHEYGTLFQ